MTTAAQNLAKLNEARALIAMRSFRSAEELLLTIVKSDPNAGAAWHELGVVYFNGKNFEKSAEAYGEHKKLEPNEFIANFSLALALVELKRDAEALSLLKEAARLDPSHLRTHELITHLQRPNTDETTKGNNSAQLGGKNADHAIAGASQVRRRNQDNAKGESSDDESNDSGKLSERLKIGEADPGRLLFKGRPLKRNYLIWDIIAILVIVSFFFVAINMKGADGLFVLFLGLFLGFGSFIIGLIVKHTDHYEIYERRLDIRNGLIFRRTYSVWAHDIKKVYLLRNPLNFMFSTCKIQIDTKDKRVIFLNSFMSVEKMDSFFQALRDTSLIDARDLKGTWFDA